MHWTPEQIIQLVTIIAGAIVGIFGARHIANSVPQSTVNNILDKTPTTTNVSNIPPDSDTVSDVHTEISTSTNKGN